MPASAGRILLVQGGVANSPTLELVLAGAGYEVVSGVDGGDVEVHLKDGVFDLVVLDFMMPDIEALRLCRAIRRLSSVPIVMLSARGNEDEIVQALDSGADDHLNKPFGSRELLARIRRCLDRARMLPIELETAVSA